MWKTVIVSSQDQHNKTQMSVNKVKKYCFVSSRSSVLSSFSILFWAIFGSQLWQMAIKQLNFEPACDLKTPPGTHTYSSSNLPSCFFTKFFNYHRTPPLIKDCFLKVIRTSCSAAPLIFLQVTRKCNWRHDFGNWCCGSIISFITGLNFFSFFVNSFSLIFIK